MRWLIPMMLVAGCAHESQSAAKALTCADVTMVASAPSRDFEQPREVTGKQSAAAAVLSGIGSLFSAASSDDSRAFVPAQGTQISSPGWRHYSGCNKSIVCFDGGTCLKVEDSDLQTMALKVPVLMRQSVLEQQGKCEHAYADRRGPLVWTLSVCGKYLGCTATRGNSYGCANPDGGDVVGPGKR